MKFVQIHRPEDFKEPVNKHTCLCSAHFEGSCFTWDLTIVESMSEQNMRQVLIKGSVPTRDTATAPTTPILTQREKRQVSLSFAHMLVICDQKLSLVCVFFLDKTTCNEKSWRRKVVKEEIHSEEMTECGRKSNGYIANNIAKWIRTSCLGTAHFYDMWHVAR